MKKLLTLLLPLCLATGCSAQKSFEGEAVYTVSFISHSPNVTGEKIADMLGRTMRYYTKGGKYKSTFDGLINQWYAYTGKGKLYIKLSNKDSLVTADLTVNHDTIIKTELKKNDTTILGHQCNKLIFYCNSGIQIYYYDPQFTVDPELYTLHQEGNWHEYLKIAKAVALKQVIDRKLYTVIATATSIERKPLDDAFFELPKNIPVAKQSGK